MKLDLQEYLSEMRREQREDMASMRELQASQHREVLDKLHS